MKNLSLAEKILCLVTYQLETRNKHITELKLKEILGNPPRSTFYRVLRMLLNGGIEYRPMLKDLETDESDKRFHFYFEIKR